MSETLLDKFFRKKLRIPYSPDRKTYNLTKQLKICEKYKTFDVNIELHPTHIEFKYTFIATYRRVSEYILILQQELQNQSFKYNGHRVFYDFDIKIQSFEYLFTMLESFEENERIIVLYYPGFELYENGDRDDVIGACLNIDRIPKMPEYKEVVFYYFDVLSYRKDFEIAQRLNPALGKGKNVLEVSEASPKPLKLTCKEPVHSLTIEEHASETLDNEILEFFTHLNSLCMDFDPEKLISYLKYSPVLGIYISKQMFIDLNTKLADVLHVVNSSFKGQYNLKKSLPRCIKNPIDRLSPLDFITAKSSKSVMPGMETVSLLIPPQETLRYIMLFEKYRCIRHKSFINVHGILSKDGNHYIVIDKHDNQAFKNAFMDPNTSINKKLKWIKRIIKLVSYCKFKKIYDLYITMDNISLQADTVKVIPWFEVSKPLENLSPEELIGFTSPTSEEYRIGLLIKKIFDNTRSIPPYNPSRTFASMWAELQTRFFPLIDEEIKNSKINVSEIIRELLNYNWKYRLLCEELKDRYKSLYNTL